jgi:hypothetical protein
MDLLGSDWRDPKRSEESDPFAEPVPRAAQRFAQPCGDVDRGVHLAGLDLLEIAPADVRLLGKLLLSQARRHPQAVHVFAEFLMGPERHPPHLGEARSFESEVCFAFSPNFRWKFGAAVESSATFMSWTKARFFHLGFRLLFACAGFGSAAAPLRIAAAEPAKGPAQPAQARQPAGNFRVLQRQVVDLGERSIIFNRVAPPAPAKAQARATQSAASPTSGTTAEVEEPQKKFEVLSLSATVYDHRVTELRWSHDQREYRAFSNIDFNYFCGVGEIETEDTVYMLIMGIGDQPRENAANVPLPESFSPTRSEYRLSNETESAVPLEALAAMDALHRYFDSHRARLIEEHAKREAQRIAREEWLKAHPPVPKDTVINFWPKKSTLYPTP